MPILIVVLSLPFLYILIRKPILRRLAIRNAVRRPRESLLVIAGSSSGFRTVVFFPELIRVPSTSGRAGYSGLSQVSVTNSSSIGVFSVAALDEPDRLSSFELFCSVSSVSVSVAVSASATGEAASTRSATIEFEIEHANWRNEIILIPVGRESVG